VNRWSPSPLLLLAGRGVGRPVCPKLWACSTTSTLTQNLMNLRSLFVARFASDESPVLLARLSSNQRSRTRPLGSLSSLGHPATCAWVTHGPRASSFEPRASSLESRRSRLPAEAHAWTMEGVSICCAEPSAPLPIMTAAAIARVLPLTRPRSLHFAAAPQSLRRTCAEPAQRVRRARAETAAQSCERLGDSVSSPALCGPQGRS
jgi:hypothetical protein